MSATARLGSNGSFKAARSGQRMSLQGRFLPAEFPIALPGSGLLQNLLEHLAQAPKHRQVRRVVDVIAQPAAWHIELDLCGRIDDRQRGERP